MRKADIVLVNSALVPTNDLEITFNPENMFKSRSSVNEFTCPQGGLVFPQEEQVVRPTRVSCWNGTPTIISYLATRMISLHAVCTSGMCSNTSAQNTQSKELSAKSSFFASPATVTTPGHSNVGFCKSRAVTSGKCSVRSLAKCPSRVPISSTERRPFGNTRSKSFVRSCSDLLDRYSAYRSAFMAFLSRAALQVSRPQHSGYQRLATARNEAAQTISALHWVGVPGGDRAIRVVTLLEAYSVTGSAKAVLEFAREVARADSNARPIELCIVTFARGAEHLETSLTAILRQADARQTSSKCASSPNYRSVKRWTALLLTRVFM